MIYIENAAKGLDGFTTHVMTLVFSICFSKFLGRPFFLDYEIPCSTPPEYASRPEFKDKFSILMNSERSLVSQLVDMPADRVFEIDRTVSNKASYEKLYSYFATTDEMKARFGQTAIWDFFGFGRFSLTREELQTFDLIEWTHTSMSNPSCFYFLPRKDKEALLASIQVRFIPEIESLASDIIGDLGTFNAVHIRLGDFLTNYATDQFPYRIEAERFREYVDVNFPDRSIPVLIATDGLQEKEVFATIFEGYKTVFIDEFIFDNFRERYEALPYTDFNSLTILNQLICAAGELFIGTYRSTFTSMIHRLRQERYGKKDFLFLPDERVAVLLGPDMKIHKDRTGFFDWNGYTVFTPDHATLSWRREWDFDLTSIDF
jgi:hypothetical protein